MGRWEPHHVSENVGLPPAPMPTRHPNILEDSMHLIRICSNRLFCKFNLVVQFVLFQLYLITCQKWAYLATALHIQSFHHPLPLN